MRMVGAEYGTDLRGPTVCEVLGDGEVGDVMAKLGPDPLRSDADPSWAWTRISKSRRTIGALLMDHTVIAGGGATGPKCVLVPDLPEVTMFTTCQISGGVGELADRSRQADWQETARTSPGVWSFDQHHSGRSWAYEKFCTIGCTDFGDDRRFGAGRTRCRN
jgi:hypothetical protein